MFYAFSNTYGIGTCATDGGPIGRVRVYPTRSARDAAVSNDNALKLEAISSREARRHLIDEAKAGVYGTLYGDSIIEELSTYKMEELVALVNSLRSMEEQYV